MSKAGTVRTHKANYNYDAAGELESASFDEIRIKTLGPVTHGPAGWEKDADETTIACPFSCDADGEPVDAQLMFSRVGKFLFCPECHEGFVE